MINKLITSSLISNAIGSFKQAQAPYVNVFNEVVDGYENQFLLFLKPELTLGTLTKEQLLDIIELVLSKVEDFNLKISSVNIMSAGYLEKHNIIAQHYGVINQIATNAKSFLSETAQKKFIEHFGASVREVNALGGIEFLKRYPMFNAVSLDMLWQNNPNIKLAGGTYAQAVKIDAEPVVLLNGFHPRQLLHFTEPGRVLVAFTLNGNISWQQARNQFCGATRPSDAQPGSIRSELLQHKNRLGLHEVSQGVNGIHLSAGPIEAAIEINRYQQNYELPTTDIYSSALAQKLKVYFTQQQLEFIFTNQNLTLDGKIISVFDATEELNTLAAIEKLRACLK